MKHVYLSPHLDDVVLSCGGAIHRHTAAGDTVLVINIFSGDAPPGVDLSPFARIQHDYWGTPPRPMALRRAEDGAALAWLAAEGQYLDLPDAVYRPIPGGELPYASEEALWAEVHPADPMARDGARELAGRLAALIPREDASAIYAPLGVNNHVDHQIVRAAAQRLLQQGYRLAFYEDYPYAEQQQELERSLKAAGVEDWRAEIIALSTADVEAKVAAIGYYRSQMGVLFGGVEAMICRVWAFAATRSPAHGLAERIWWPLIV